MKIWIIGGCFILACIAIWFWMRAGWIARRRRQVGMAHPTPAPTELGDAVVESDLFYVATTVMGDQLDRVAVGGLGFRGRAVVSVHPEGVVLDIAGESPILLERAAIQRVDRATWAIDRVVESDGLIMITWQLGDQLVDTYLRDTIAPAALVAAIRELITTTGEKTT